jgi:hypothetical protein
MRSGSHVQLAALRNRTLSYRQPRHLVIMDQWNGEQRAVATKFCWIASIFVGTFNSSRFLCHLVYLSIHIFFGYRIALI